MIISHKHKFIFLHCRKTAGSSLTVALNQFLGPDDIQTSAWEETIAVGGKINKNIYKILIRQIYKKPRRSFSFFANQVIGDSKNAKFVRQSVKKYYNRHLCPKSDHATAMSVQQFDPIIWNQYFKFCFIRNPFDHAVSDFYWKACPRKGVTFEEFLLRKSDPDRPDPERVVEQPVTNWPIYTINGTVAIDFVAKYENMNSNLKKLESILGLTPITMPKIKAKSTSRIQTGLNLYNRRTIDLVERLYEKEINCFGYSFDEFRNKYEIHENE
jgi:hypothetical protein